MTEVPHVYADTDSGLDRTVSRFWVPGYPIHGISVVVVELILGHQWMRRPRCWSSERLILQEILLGCACHEVSIPHETLNQQAS